MTSCLELLRRELERLNRFPSTPYSVPGLWVGAGSQRVEMPSTTAYFLGVLEAMEVAGRDDAPAHARRLWYNAMVRHVTSYDHGPAARSVGWRSTGTFLKLLALLPYLQRLGVGTLMLLPISSIGSVGRKGSHGSAYAVRNPFCVEEALAEPLLKITPEQQARALVEAAHALGIQVISEVVLRTASLDSVLVKDHPEWFYWIRSQLVEGEVFQSPAFSVDQVARIRTMIEAGQRQDLPEPSAEYRHLFAEPPADATIGAGGWHGRTLDGEEVRLPGAFADWPPDDRQPPWNDVTYLKLHHHPDFNYMAYNTIRMFDAKLDRPGAENSGVWNMIASVIPTHMRMLGVDGAMIDMGHALPAALRRRVIDDARAERADAVMIEENFHLDEASRQDGFDVVTGYLPFDAHTADGLRGFVQRLAAEGSPVRYLACGESHNTPRWATRLHADLVPAAWLFLSLLPKAVPLVVAGMELGETRPINTGLGFTTAESSALTAEMLPLFSDVPLPWDQGAEHHGRLLDTIRGVSDLDILRIISDDDTVDDVGCSESGVVAYHRCLRERRRGLLVVLNMNVDEVACSLDVQKLSLAAIGTSDRCSLQLGALNCKLGAHSAIVVATHTRQPEAAMSICDANQRRA
jgi:starch synthase (maltosyl-transferring)